MNEKPRENNTLWPGKRVAVKRLLIIALIFFPISWAIYALLVGDWGVTWTEEESVRHFVEWMVNLAGVIAVVFLASLLPAFGTAHRFLNWLLSGRIIRRMAWAAVWILTAIALFYTEENWRGARAWNRYRTQLEAGGTQLDFAAFIPKPIPDAQNFAATPVVKAWFPEADRTVSPNAGERFLKNWGDSYQHADTRFEGNEPTNRHFMDLARYGKAFDAFRLGEKIHLRIPASDELSMASRAAAVPAVLTGLKPTEKELAELQAASRMPLSRYPLVYDLDNPWGILLPPLANVRAACLRLQLRACAELAAGQSEQALTDVKLILYLADTLKDEPLIISSLVRSACVQMAIQPVWEGLAEHAWRDSQLQELQALFEQYDFVADMQRPVDGERAAGILTVDVMKKKGLGLLMELIGPENPTSADKKFANWCGAFIPRGWYDMEQVNYCRLYPSFADEPAFGHTRKRISPGPLKTNLQKIQRELYPRTISYAGLFLHHKLIAFMLVPALTIVCQKTAAVQTAADQADIACALERYRLANGNFPESLDALRPKFISRLPSDVITGEPMKYRRTTDGQFILYSIGWDEKDDGGTPGKTLFDEKHGDWVWQYPAR